MIQKISKVLKWPEWASRLVIHVLIVGLMSDSVSYYGDCLVYHVNSDSSSSLLGLDLGLHHLVRLKQTKPPKPPRLPPQYPNEML